MCRRLVAVLSMLALAAGVAGAGLTPAQRCAAGKQKAAGKNLAAQLACYAQAKATGAAVDAACLMRAELKFTATFTRLATGCPGDGPTVGGLVDACVGAILGDVPGTGRCFARSADAVGRAASRLMICAVRDFVSPGAFAACDATEDVKLEAALSHVGSCAASSTEGDLDADCVTPIVTALPPGTAAADWSGSMVAWWPWDGNGHDVNGTCGASCDLTSNGPMAFDTTSVAQGTESVAPDGRTTRYGSCVFSNCGALNFGASADFTFGTAIRSTVTSPHLESLFDSEADATAGGYFAVVQPLSATAGNWSCGVCDGSGTNCNQVDAQGALGTSSGFGWVACKYTHANNSVVPYVGATPLGTFAMPAYAPANGTLFTFPSSPNTSACGGGPCQFAGEADDGWVFEGAMADASVCRICACNVDGKACGPNACNGTSYTACDTDADCGAPTVAGACDTTGVRDCAAGTKHCCKGRRHTKCGDCTMPSACNQATP